MSKARSIQIQWQPPFPSPPHPLLPSLPPLRVIICKYLYVWIFLQSYAGLHVVLAIEQLYLGGNRTWGVACGRPAFHTPWLKVVWTTFQFIILMMQHFRYQGFQRGFIYDEFKHDLYIYIYMTYLLKLVTILNPTLFSLFIKNKNKGKHS